ncbi:MAG: Crp/Fnr family transcriptional regulator [Caulobacteraceae bacterium]
MTSLDQTSIANRLLAAMPSEAFEAVRTHLTPVPLPLRGVLAEADTPIPYVHFILDGIASTTVTTGTRRRLEVGLFGREGMSPNSILLGVDRTPYDTFMQVEGSALRAPIAALVQALQDCRPLRAFLLLYAQVMLVQTAQTALANGAFKIEERTARWLLMCHDRIDGDVLPITHEFLGLMLGVRRSGVTDAVHVLEDQGIVRPRRGIIEIIDRAGLERVAGESYGTPETEYERLVGPWRSPAKV